jgi:hypothetical protein
VTYWAQTARAWVTHGALTAPMGLTATLMYGFSAPDGRSWILLGSVPGAVSDAGASGAWTGYLYGLVQVSVGIGAQVGRAALRAGGEPEGGRCPHEGWRLVGCSIGGEQHCCGIRQCKASCCCVDLALHHLLVSAKALNVLQSPPPTPPLTKGCVYVPPLPPLPAQLPGP